MAIMRIVPKEDWDVLWKYLGAGSGAVLVREDVLTELPDKQREAVKESDNNVIDYDFGGDADMWVETVLSADHYFFDSMFPEEEESEGAQDA